MIDGRNKVGNGMVRGRWTVFQWRPLAGQPIIRLFLNPEAASA